MRQPTFVVVPAVQERLLTARDEPTIALRHESLSHTSAPIHRMKPRRLPACHLALAYFAVNTSIQPGQSIVDLFTARVMHVPSVVGACGCGREGGQDDDCRRCGEQIT